MTLPTIQRDGFHTALVTHFPDWDASQTRIFTAGGESFLMQSGDRYMLIDPILGMAQGLQQHSDGSFLAHGLSHPFELRNDQESGASARFGESTGYETDAPWVPLIELSPEVTNGLLPSIMLAHKFIPHVTSAMTFMGIEKNTGEKRKLTHVQKSSGNAVVWEEPEDTSVLPARVPVLAEFEHGDKRLVILPFGYLFIDQSRFAKKKISYFEVPVHWENDHETSLSIVRELGIHNTKSYFNDWSNSEMIELVKLLRDDARLMSDLEKVKSIRNDFTAEAAFPEHKQHLFKIVADTTQNFSRRCDASEALNRIDDPEITKHLFEIIKICDQSERLHFVRAIGKTLSDEQYDELLAIYEHSDEAERSHIFTVIATSHHPKRFDDCCKMALAKDISRELKILFASTIASNFGKQALPTLHRIFEDMVDNTLLLSTYSIIKVAKFFDASDFQRFKSYYHDCFERIKKDIETGDDEQHTLDQLKSYYEIFLICCPDSLARQDLLDLYHNTEEHSTLTNLSNIYERLMEMPDDDGAFAAIMPDFENHEDESYRHSFLKAMAKHPDANTVKFLARIANDRNASAYEVIPALKGLAEIGTTEAIQHIMNLNPKFHWTGLPGNEDEEKRFWLIKTAVVEVLLSIDSFETLGEALLRMRDKEVAPNIYQRRQMMKAVARICKTLPMDQVFGVFGSVETMTHGLY